MAKNTLTKAKAAKKVGGPFVAAAVLCESVSEEPGGVISVKRIVDEIRAVVPLDVNIPSEAEPLPVSLMAVLIIRRGDAAAGKHTLRLVVNTPQGKTSELAKAVFEMPKYANGAATIRMNLSLGLRSEGVFWIDVILGQKCLTRMPLNLILVKKTS